MARQTRETKGEKTFRISKSILSKWVITLSVFNLSIYCVMELFGINLQSITTLNVRSSSQNLKDRKNVKF